MRQSPGRGRTRVETGSVRGVALLELTLVVAVTAVATIAGITALVVIVVTLVSGAS